MSLPPTWPADDVIDDDQSDKRRTLAPRLLPFLISVIAAGGAAVLVLTTDPGPREERIFIALILLAAAGLGSISAKAFSARTERPLGDNLRALRRGILFGLACAGAIVLQLNAAFSPTNLAFLLLVLVIVEMIFLARRQHPI